MSCCEETVHLNSPLPTIGGDQGEGEISGIVHFTPT